ncbi:hypothetical protein Fcan01_21609 [Folsomia candida]|uniref:Uncharacterized protein n=1 Tax=Folsomia candida TaxID=158441 RepID=A0A226DGA8_FOLCA|nr:hypothetical protein Fcan01_21609 [Folsomia candida]
MNSAMRQTNPASAQQPLLTFTYHPRSQTNSVLSLSSNSQGKRSHTRISQLARVTQVAPFTPLPPRLAAHQLHLPTLPATHIRHAFLFNLMKKPRASALLPQPRPSKKEPREVESFRKNRKIFFPWCTTLAEGLGSRTTPFGWVWLSAA